MPAALGRSGQGAATKAYVDVAQVDIRGGSRDDRLRRRRSAARIFTGSWPVAHPANKRFEANSAASSKSS